MSNHEFEIVVGSGVSTSALLRNWNQSTLFRLRVLRVLRGFGCVKLRLNLIRAWSESVTSSVTFQLFSSVLSVSVISIIVDVCLAINVGFNPWFSTIRSESKMNSSSSHSPYRLFRSPIEHYEHCYPSLLSACAHLWYSVVQVLLVFEDAHLL